MPFKKPYYSIKRMNREFEQGIHNLQQFTQKQWHRFEGAILRKSSAVERQDLLAPGYIEQLVKEGRIPAQIGEIGSPGKEMQAFYEVPPEGYNPNDLEVVLPINSGGYAFRLRNGEITVGKTYVLTKEEVIEAEDRIAKARIAWMSTTQFTG